MTVATGLSVFLFLDLVWDVGCLALEGSLGLTVFSTGGSECSDFDFFPENTTFHH